MIAATYAMAIAVLVVAIIIVGMVYRHLWELGWRVRAELYVRRIGRDSWPLGGTCSCDHWSETDVPFSMEESYQLSVSLYLLWVNAHASVELIKP